MPQLPATAFDYAALKKSERNVVRQKTTEIRDRMGRAAQNIVEIGERLIAVQELLGPRKFAPWVRAEFDWSESAALKMMQVARQFIGVNFTGIDVAPSALYLLAAPSTPEPVREAFIESARNGHPVTHAAVKAAVTPPVRPSNGHAGGGGVDVKGVRALVERGYDPDDLGDDDEEEAPAPAVPPAPADPAVLWFRAVNVLESVLTWLPDQTTLAALPEEKRKFVRERLRGLARQFEQAV